MNTLLIPKLMRIEIPPMNISKDLFSFGILGAFDLSKMIKPRPPREKRNDAARPSMIYCPLTLPKNCKFDGG